MDAFAMARIQLDSNANEPLRGISMGSATVPRNSLSQIRDSSNPRAVSPVGTTSISAFGCRSAASRRCKSASATLKSPTTLALSSGSPPDVFPTSDVRLGQLPSNAAATRAWLRGIARRSQELSCAVDGGEGVTLTKDRRESSMFKKIRHQRLEASPSSRQGAAAQLHGNQGDESHCVTPPKQSKNILQRTPSRVQSTVGRYPFSSANESVDMSFAASDKGSHSTRSQSAPFVARPMLAALTPMRSRSPAFTCKGSRTTRTSNADNATIIGDTSHSPVGLRDTKKDSGFKDFDVREFVHPAFTKMPEPSFRCETGGVLTRASISAHAKPAQTPEKSSPKKLTTTSSTILEMASEYAFQLHDTASSLPVRGTPEQMMAALSLALFANGASEHDASLPAVCFEVKQDSAHTRSVAAEVLRVWHEWRTYAASGGQKELYTLGAHEGSLNWIGSNNLARCCMERLACACSTLRYAPSLGSVQNMIEGTRLLSWSMHGATELDHNPVGVKITTTDIPGALEATLCRAQGERERVVAMVAQVTPHSLGGRLLSGSKHTSEEELCTRSSLYFSLRQAMRLGKASGLCDNDGRPIYVPEDGVVVSPSVEVFRYGAGLGYSMRPNSLCLAGVLSLSMPNLVDKPHLAAEKDYPELLRRKFEMLLKGASQCGAGVLVMTDVGCAQSGNEPCVVGRMFASALLSARYNDMHVVLAGSEDFKTSVCAAVG